MLLQRVSRREFSFCLSFTIRLNCFWPLSDSATFCGKALPQCPPFAYPSLAIFATTELSPWRTVHNSLWASLLVWGKVCQYAMCPLTLNKRIMASTFDVVAKCFRNTLETNLVSTNPDFHKLSGEWPLAQTGFQTAVQTESTYIIYITVWTCARKNALTIKMDARFEEFPSTEECDNHTTTSTMVGQCLMHPPILRSQNEKKNEN